MLTNKSLANCLFENESAASVVRVTLSENLMHCLQVQVDSIVQVICHARTYLRRPKCQNVIIIVIVSGEATGEFGGVQTPHFP